MPQCSIKWCGKKSNTSNMEKDGITFHLHGMELSCLARKLNNNLFKGLLNIRSVISRTAVNLAHKIHGKNPSEGTPIIVLHGLLGSKRNWESVSKNLASSIGMTVIATDLRNHGESPHESTHTYHDLASDVDQLLSTLSISQAVVLGHSMGGRTAMVLALTSPFKISKLVIVDISPVSTPGLLNDFFPRLIEVMKTIDFQGAENVGQARNIAKDKILASGIVPNAQSAHFILMNVGVRYDKAIGWLVNIDTLKEYFDTIATFPTDLQGKTYPGPTLFIGGDQSNYLPSSDLSGIKQYFPKADLKYISGVGHNVHAENPGAFINMVAQFISAN